ncbi:hypothetical protein ONZ43_g2429 [Nemania bipapillata]|uniref:Uncharacterized protein n=1 Tax=Nemania bipapillata TaxID=110536 RepID=A0ACC2J0V4_9PEZI|nr:hypothetical protein ONZ43_g2429 [Nemania bipapillata]
MSQGYAICWWLKALRGARLAQLQFDLGVQHSLTAFLQRSRTFDLFAIAALIALAVSVADGPLLQQATTTTSKAVTSNNNTVTVYVSPEKLPSNFSQWGASSGSTDLGYILQPVFANVSKAYAARDVITLPNSGCEDNSTCTISMLGPGFDVACNESDLPYDFHNLGSADPNHSNYTTFLVDFQFGGYEVLSEYSMVNFTAVYKPDASCVGSFTVKQCVMRLATVKYPVTIRNNTSVLQKWEPSMNQTIEIIQFNSSTGYDDVFTGATGDFQSMLGGIVSVADSLYSSSANLRQVQMINSPYLANVSGQAASNYLTSDSSTYGNCSMTWEDPSVDIVNTIQELMFRSAIANSIANVSYATPQRLPATSTKTVIAYVTHYQYLGIALVIMALELGIIFFLLSGWQALGRDVSLDTFEISKALGAPVLQEAGSNSTVDEILKVAGKKNLRYGELIGKDAGETKATSAVPLLSPSHLSINAATPWLPSGTYELLPQGKITPEMYNATDSGDEYYGSLPTISPQLRFGEIIQVRPARPNVQYY